MEGREERRKEGGKRRKGEKEDKRMGERKEGEAELWLLSSGYVSALLSGIY